MPAPRAPPKLRTSFTIHGPSYSIGSSAARKSSLSGTATSGGVKSNSSDSSPVTLLSSLIFLSSGATG